MLGIRIWIPMLTQQVFYLLSHFPRSRRSHTNISELIFWGSAVFVPSSLATSLPITQYPTRITWGRRTHFGTQFESIAHHGWKVKVMSKAEGCCSSFFTLDRPRSRERTLLSRGLCPFFPFALKAGPELIGLGFKHQERSAPLSPASLETHRNTER